MPQDNPFIFGDPVRGDDFLNRRREMRRLAGRIRSGGSAVVTAEPRMGKTSLLLHLQAAAADLFGEQANRVVFCYLDGHTMSGWDAARFWKEALHPLRRLPQMGEVYDQGIFNLNVGERIFQKLERDGYRFTLLLDEFDALQSESGLHQRAVYGTLRSLASRYRSFSLVVSSRRAITDLNAQSHDFAAGSPFFNFMQEITLSPFPQKDMAFLLSRGGERFTQADRVFLKRISGQHPYFLQTAAYYLYDWYEEEDAAAVRYQKTSRDFYRSTGEAVLTDIWHSWTPYMQMAFTLAALERMPLLLGEKRQFDIGALLRDLPNFAPELRKLDKRGFLHADADAQNGYVPHAEVMLWYLADELTRAIRPEIGLETWLTRQQWEGLLKRGEKEALGRAFRQAGGFLQEGAKAFIKAAAEGAAKGMVS